MKTRGQYPELPGEKKDADLLALTIERNPKGLVDALFDSIDAVRTKQMTPEESRAISHSCRSIVNVARMEMDYLKMRSESLTHDDLKSISFDEKK